MAYRPSRRLKHMGDTEHPNVTPMMNLMVVLIPLLLTSAEFVKLGVIELNLPPAASGSEGQTLAAMPQEAVRRLDLTVTITDRGFFISSSLAVLTGSKGEPTLPKINGGYDFSGLSEKLYEIKKEAVLRFPDHDQIIIMAEEDVDYQTIISTMDASRSIEDHGQVKALFPEVALSAGVM